MVSRQGFRDSGRIAVDSVCAVGLDRLGWERNPARERREEEEEEEEERK